MSFSKQLLIWILGIVTALVVTTLPTLATSSLTQEEIDLVAAQTTVVIAQGLERGVIEAGMEWNPGSGVLVSRNGNTYYALTNVHVVRTRGVVYGARTSDGNVHIIDDTDTRNNIILFGKEKGKLGAQSIEGYDFAIVEFKSDRDYPVVAMGDSSQLRSGDKVFVSGWPNPDDGNPKRHRKLSNGVVSEIVNPPSVDGGYSILYNNWTRRGMSGGPVFNANAELVGIHGRGAGTQNNCSPNTEMNSKNSCGIRVIHFITQAEAAQINLAFKSPPVEPSAILSGKRNRRTANVIPNIYKIFTSLESRIRDCPTGVLIDQPGCE